MNTVLGDLRLALRGLRRSPLFSIVAILSLALGIGANTAIFTLLDQILLRKLPVNAPDELVMLYQRGPHNGSNMGSRMHSYPIYQDYQKRAEPLAEVICRRLIPASVSIDNRTERVGAEMVSGNYFSMLGVKPAIGRVFNSKEDDQMFRGHPVGVLSYDYWNTRFARDPNIVGKKILVNDYPMEIVGVSAKGFAGLDPAQAPQIRVPDSDGAGHDARVGVASHGRPPRPLGAGVRAVEARLHRGIGQGAAAGPLHADPRVRDDPAGGEGVVEVLARAVHEGTADRRERGDGLLELRNDFSTALIVLMCMVGLVLLIACANVANLLIARGFMRQKEIAVRLSLGASRGRLVRQLLVESLVLSFVGRRRSGSALPSCLTRGLLALVPRRPAAADHARTRICASSRSRLSLTFVTGIVFGLLPALRASRPDPWTTLKDTVGIDRRHRRIAVPAKGAGDGAGRAQLPAALRRRPVRAEPAEPEDDRHRRRARQPRDVPAVAGPQRIRRRPRDGQFYGELLERLRSAPGVKSAALRGRLDSERRRVGQLAWRSKGTSSRTARTCRRS